MTGNKPDREISAALKSALELERKHVKICGKCSGAGRRYGQRCQEGWDLARGVSRQRELLELSRQSAVSGPGQESLF